MPSPTPAPPIASNGHGVDLDWLAAKVDYSLYQQCVHCGLCTASCPTYVELGDENDGPRGRIYLMRAVADGRIPASEAVRRHAFRGWRQAGAPKHTRRAEPYIVKKNQEDIRYPLRRPQRHNRFESCFRIFRVVGCQTNRLPVGNRQNFAL